MHKDEVELFFKRAENFLITAKDRFQKKDWDLTCFLSEQFVQLSLKALILEIGGEFPNTHSIRKLVALLYRLTNEEKLKFDRKELSFLESAYLNSRYFNYIYDMKEAKEALDIAKKIKKVIKNVRFDETKKGND